MLKLLYLIQDHYGLKVISYQNSVSNFRWSFLINENHDDLLEAGKFMEDTPI